MEFNYSVVIRTLGNAGEKYIRMMHAIEAQTMKPTEVIVVIPHGYTLNFLTGYERIVHSNKGMVTQRAVGIDEAKEDYLLVLDDDLYFPPDFAEKLYEYSIERNLDCVLAFGNGNTDEGGGVNSAPRNTSLKQTAQHLRLAFTGQAFYSHRQSEYFDTIAATGGHRTHINNEYGLCQTGAFACCFIKSDTAKAVHFQEEAWLEQGSLSTYAAYDDAVFYYKLYSNGARIAYTHNTDFTHLDAAAGRPAKKPIEARRIRLYTIARNRTIFWCKLIYGRHRSLKNLLGGWYGIINYGIYNILINLHPKRWPAIAALLHGYADAFSYIRSQRL